MDEYISRDAVLKKLQMQLLDLEADQDKGEYSELCENRGARDALDEAIYDIRTLKDADVQPVIHAHWRHGEEKGFKTYNPLWYCSNCGGQIRYDTRMRQYQKIKRPVWEVNAFCRKCGARMDGDTE